jgi:hypothetical protein
MKRFDIHNATVAELVDRFATICVAQNDALFLHQISKFNRLYDQMAAITEELKSRSGDQRRALIALHDHRDIQVRLQAARMTLAVAPQESRRVIEAIAASKWYPQAGDAGMSLRGLDSGQYVPK